MYCPSHFVEERPEVMQQLMQSHPLGLLVTHDGQEIEANPIPWLLDPDPDGGPGILRAHVARANPVWQRTRCDVDSLVVFQGPQHYVSPNWYPSKKLTHQEVPTWNYCMVQGRGRLKVHEDADWLLDLVSRLSAEHEQAMHEQTQAQPWSVNDAPKAYIDKMLRAIVGIELVLTSLTGKWKVSQNKKEADRQGVVAALQSLEPEQARAMAAQVAEPGASPRAAR
ncbi:MAG: FMN-binding negative transcriptional regulator [Burkholderiales bacterium]